MNTVSGCWKRLSAFSAFAIAAGLHGAPIDLQITASSLELRPTTVGATTVHFSTYAPDRQPLVIQSDTTFDTSDELRPREGASDYETDVIVRQNGNTLSYAGMRLTLPTADDNGNGLPDILELARPTNATITGTISVVTPAAAEGTVTGTLQREAGSIEGQYTLQINVAGLPAAVSGNYRLVASFPEMTSATFSRGVVNQLDFSFRMPDETGAPGPQNESSTGYTILDPDTVLLTPFTFSDTSGAVYAVGATTLERDGTRYVGTALLADGSVDTPWSDYRRWHVELNSATDTDLDGIPDFSDPATSLPPVEEDTAARLVNLSTRARTGTDSDTLIVGWVLRGGATLLLRGGGPALEQFEVDGAVSDPKLAVYSGDNLLVAENDNWSSGDATAVATAAASVGAFEFEGGSADAAILAGFSNGASTAQVHSSQEGVALAEIYRTSGSSTGRLVNLSARCHAGTGDDTLIAGFVVRGEGSIRVLLRGIGPALEEFKVEGALQDPEIVLYRGKEQISLNDNWNAADAEAMASVGAFALPEGSADAAMVATLEDGTYSLHVRGKNGASGIALAEVYVLP